MREKIAGGFALVVIAALAFASAGDGSVMARGGNHGCIPGTGTLYTDNFWAAGDRIVGAYTFDEGGGLPRIPVGPQEALHSENSGADGSGPSRVSCGGDPGTFDRFVSHLGPGDDKIRLDAAPLLTKYTVPPQPLPPTITTLLSGGGGKDRLLGHKGFDKFLGGSGDDVIKAADGKRDRIKCGGGDDKAVVDRRDRFAGCERVVERSV